jgi:hypothetical protein
MSDSAGGSHVVFSALGVLGREFQHLEFQHCAAGIRVLPQQSKYFPAVSPAVQYLVATVVGLPCWWASSHAVCVLGVGDFGERVVVGAQGWVEGQGWVVAGPSAGLVLESARSVRSERPANYNGVGELGRR